MTNSVYISPIGRASTTTLSAALTFSISSVLLQQPLFGLMISQICLIPGVEPENEH
jgi:hypothetical protein